MDRDCFIVNIKTEHIYKDIAKDNETRFHTSRKKMCVYHTTKSISENFMDLWKNCIVKPYACLVTDTVFASDNPFSFGKYVAERI